MSTTSTLDTRTLSAVRNLHAALRATKRGDLVRAALEAHRAAALLLDAASAPRPSTPKETP